MPFLGTTEMTPPNPYLIRALIDWVLDNGLTPHIVIATNEPGVIVPKSCIENNKLVLNIHPDAVREFGIDENALECLAQFFGITYRIYAPIGSIISIYAKENNVGMTFSPADYKKHSVPKQKIKAETKTSLAVIDLPENIKQNSAVLGKNKTKKKNKPRLRVINCSDKSE